MIERCLPRASSYNMYINQLDGQILVIRLYFSLRALHVSDFLSVHLQEQLYKLYIAYAGICRYVWLLGGCDHMYGIVIYRRMRCTACKVAPEDALTKGPKHVEHVMRNKD